MIYIQKFVYKTHTQLTLELCVFSITRASALLKKMRDIFASMSTNNYVIIFLIKESKERE
jgi:hypothetical protein